MDVKEKKKKDFKDSNARKVQQQFWHINTQKVFQVGWLTVYEAEERSSAAQDETEK